MLDICTIYIYIYYIYMLLYMIYIYAIYIYIDPGPPWVSGHQLPGVRRRAVPEVHRFGAEAHHGHRDAAREHHPPGPHRVHQGVRGLRAAGCLGFEKVKGWKG